MNYLHRTLLLPDPHFPPPITWIHLTLCITELQNIISFEWIQALKYMGLMTKIHKLKILNFIYFERIYTRLELISLMTYLSCCLVVRLIVGSAVRFSLRVIMFMFMMITRIHDMIYFSDAYIQKIYLYIKHITWKVCKLF